MTRKRNLVPTIHHMDDLSLLPDYELQQLGNRLYYEMEESFNEQKYVVEMAYIQREQFLRQDQWNAHGRYLQALRNGPIETVNTGSEGDQTNNASA
jgi:hypothetical protein